MNDSSPLRLVIFDVDGTLVDSQAHIMAAMETAFATLGLTPPPREAVLQIVGLSLPEAMACLVPELDPKTGMLWSRPTRAVSRRCGPMASRPFRHSIPARGPFSTGF